MNHIDKHIQTKWAGLKAGISELRRKPARPGFQERGEVLRNTQDLNMPMVEMSGNEYPTDRTPQGKKRDNDFVDTRAKYVQRHRLSWTGLYGKAPWPRERKQWEKI
ncbi:MAG: hypothetical protein C4522_19940 [Desulfobacteraceae bacterium]|nr:MAG: hypothetical protein C4522_19940 [Desulfobacteraceae bacterium]